MIEFFGPFCVRLSETSEQLSARKDLALLAYLADSTGHSHRRATLAALLWPESDGPRARESLKQAALRLKRSLPPGTIDGDRNNLHVRLRLDQIDISQFDDAMQNPTTAHIEQAAALLACGFLTDLVGISDSFEDWRRERLDELSQSFFRTAQRTMRKERAQGRLDHTKRIAKAIGKIDPFDEDALRHLMECYTAEGRPRQAQKLFSDFKARLAREIDAEPEAATTALAASLNQTTVHSPKAHNGEPTLTITPFATGTDDPSQQYFGDGLADDIMTDLAQIDGLRILRAERPDARTDASHSLQGSIRKFAGRLRLNVRLLECQSGLVVWAGRYDQPIGEIFSMQDQISSEIVQTLRHSLKPANGTASARPATGRSIRTHDNRAYELFLKGRSLYLRGLYSHTLRAAKAMLQHALKIDPNYARAHALLAICDSHLAMSTVNSAGAVEFDTCLEHGSQAHKLDPGNALSHAALGLANYAQGAYADAETWLLRAVDLDASLFEAQFFLARNSRLQGRRQEAAERFGIAASIRPEDFRSEGLRGEELLAMGERTEAERCFRRCLDRIESEIEAHPDNAGALAFGAPVLAFLGETERAGEWADWARAIGAQDCLVNYNIARMHAIQGAPETALAQLTQAFAYAPLVQRRLALWLRFDEDFRTLRPMPDFQKLLAHADRPTSTENLFPTINQ